MPRGLNERAADVELDMFACGMAYFLQLHLYPVDSIGVVLRCSSMASRVDTRSGRVEFPIRLTRANNLSIEPNRMFTFAR